MTCLFCSSNNHVSHNCNIYKSDEERQTILRQKKICFNCLNDLEENIRFASYDDNFYDQDYCFPENQHICPQQFSSAIVSPLSMNFFNPEYNANCETMRKCYLCFSKEHHTVFCPDRFTAPNLFPPKIDKDLMPRFLQCLTAEEKYLLCLSFLEMFKVAKFKPFKVKCRKKISSSDIKNISDCDYFVAENACIQNIFRNFNLYHFFNDNYATGSIGLTEMKNTLFYFRHIEIYQTPFLFSEFLHLLSTKTKTLKCAKVEFILCNSKHKLPFVEILKAAPYIEEIDIHQTNVDIDNSWPDDLLQFNHAVKLTHVHLKPEEDFNFNIESLAILMKKKWTNISLSVVLPWDRRFYNTIEKKLSSHFVQYILNFSSLTINIADKSFNVINTMVYELKDF